MTQNQKVNQQEQSSGGIGTSAEELADMVQSQTTDIQVIGCGGGGSNTVNRMMQEQFPESDLVAINTDAQHLQTVHANTRVLIGKQETKGRGAGSNPDVGKSSAEEDRETINKLVDGKDMVFITAGMGGGTGTGAAPVVAEAATDSGALTIAVVTMPFKSEGQMRWSHAVKGLEELRQAADTVITIPNDRLLDLSQGTPLQEAFRYCDEVLMRSVQGVTDLITTNGVVNLDFADLQTVMANGDVAMIGMGQSKSDERATDVVDSAIRSPLLNVDISEADSVLVNVSGDASMSVDEAEGVVRELHERVSDSAQIIWGSTIDEELDNEMRALIVVTGVDSDQIMGSESGTPDLEPPEDSFKKQIDHIA